MRENGEMAEKRGYLKVKAFRRLGDGQYSFSTIMMIEAKEQWTAVTLNTSKRDSLVLGKRDTTPVIGCGSEGRFNNPDLLIKHLYERWGFVLLMDGVEDKLLG